MFEPALVRVLLLGVTLISALTARTTHLVIEDDLFQTIQAEIPAEFDVIKKSVLNGARLVDSLARGNSCIWIGAPVGLPPDLWIGSFRPAQAPLEVQAAPGSPVIFEKIPFRKSTVSSVYIKPLVELPSHNIDEEQRATLEPILEARDRFGRVIGYPGALMRYYAPSLVRHRFSGTGLFLFLFDKPAEAMPSGSWVAILKAISRRMRAGVQLTRSTSNYASYRAGEHARITAHLRNMAPEARSAEIRFFVKGPKEENFHLVDQLRRIPDGDSESQAETDVLLKGNPGVWTFRIELCQDLGNNRDLAIEGRPEPIDRTEIRLVVIAAPLTTPSIVTMDGPGIRIENESAFWAGTNYYPSSSWWEWLWRDFRPLQADEDFAAMRRAGYRIVRIWVDPVLDEQSLRAMDAAIYLAARHGIVLDVCVFTQWVRTIGFERAGSEHVRFDFRRPRDFNVYGISFRNLNLQREYIGILASRWRKAGNLIYNLSNETYVNDPDATQMDPEAAKWSGIPTDKGDLRNSLLFQRWSDEMSFAIRKTGASQPVMPGYLFSLMGGGDAYVANRHGAAAAWHSYSSPANTAASLSYFNASCSSRPLLLEEFGVQGWNRTDAYDGAVHAALGAGAAAAMSYEWGVRWLAPEQSFGAAPLREILDAEPDVRWFAPVLDIAKKWPKQVPGLNFSPSGFYYGSIYSGTPFPAAAAVALGRLGLMGTHLAPAAADYSAYLVVPSGAPAKTTTNVINIIEQLQRVGLEFGILHEDCLQTRFPESARTLIVPVDLSSTSTKLLGTAGKKGLRILKNRQDWEAARDLPRARLQPPGESADGTSTLVRHTSRGRLYTLMTTGRKAFVNLALTSGSATFSLDRYAVIAESSNGVTFVETAGELILNGKRILQVQSGRVLISSDDGLPLGSSKRVRVITTEPTEIRFTRPMASVAVLEAGGSKPISLLPEAQRQTTLKIDSELNRYVALVEF
jgi:hypothetical protein